MNITKATLKDIPWLVALINSAYRGEDSKKGWTTEADLLDGMRTNADSLAEMINNEKGTILKFCNNDKALQGCVYLEKNADKLYLGMLTVSPLVQSKGIGKQLLVAAEQYAKNNACLAIEMTVISVRNELISWYEKQGYYKTGKIKPFPADLKFGIPKQPLEFIVMEKTLHEV